MALKSGQLDFQGFPAIRFRPETSEDAPANPESGQQWHKESTGVTSIFSSGAWKAVNHGSGSGGTGTLEVYEFQMPAPAATVTIDHALGRNPVAVQVFHEGVLCDEYGVFYTVPGQQIQISFDIPISALIRLL